MKYLVLLQLIFLSIVLSAQESQNPIQYAIDKPFILNSEVKEKIQLNDSIYLVKKYYPSGRLYSETEVLYQEIIDTSYTEDLDTGEMTMVTQHFKKEIFNGLHTSYSDSAAAKIIARGNYINGIKKGEWRSYFLGFEEKFSYDDNGKLISYTSFFKDNMVRMEGKFCEIPSYILEVEKSYYDNSNGIKYYPQPCGIWSLYNENGDLIQKITYEHVNWK